MAAKNTEVWQTGTVVEVSDAADNIKMIVLAPALPMKAEPGSHIDVRVSINGHTDKRAYSVVESSQEGHRLVICVLKVPLSRGGSVFMHNLEVGERLEFTQPLQNFPLRLGAERYVLLAGGVGITAVVHMAKVLRDLHLDYKLVYAGRSRSRMAFVDELDRLHGRNLIVHADDEGAPLEVRNLIATITAGTELYMCGPIRLMDAVRRSWIEHELSYPNLRYETFGNSGWFDAEEFIVRVPTLDLEVTVGQEQSMLEALEDAGADMMFSCRKGECGLCEVQVLNLEGRIDHRDVFYSERQKGASGKIACCVSRAVVASINKRPAASSAGGRAVVTIDLP